MSKKRSDKEYPITLMDKLFNTYLREIRKNLRLGIATEHTHRSALKTLIESMGENILATNEPRRVRCGAPDYVVTKKATAVGYIEAKDVGLSLDSAEKSDQMKKYLAALGNLILTDYLEYRWYVDGSRRAVARLGVADAHGKITPDRSGAEGVASLLADFLAHRAAGISTPKELALRMARLAHMIRDLIVKAFQDEPDSGALHNQLTAFREVLLPDLTPEQFADMYAQTIVYGLFAARCTENGARKFTRRNAAYLLPKTNPFLRKLFNQIAGPDLDDRIAWLVDDLAQVLDQADMAEVLRDFGKRTAREDPVVHFYETFLASYDPAIREMRGVYYTPEPVVSYIVRSVDHLLKTRFGRSMGLADENTLILDPAVGTGTFLYFVMREIYESLQARGQAGAWNEYAAEKLLPRIFGFELLMAPYAVAHLKLGLQLKELGYRFDRDERLGIYLTNTLEQAEKISELRFAQFIAEEANKASEIKRDKPIMVVLGNPPYSGHSANRSWEIRQGKRVRTSIGELLRDYYYADGRPLGERNPKWLQDDYVKFIRFGQWRIERTGQGILTYISNHGYLDNPTFRGMRQNLMNTFTDIYLLDLHGNAKKKEKCPDGSRDENVFDIQQGVAIGIFVKEPGKTGPARVYHTDIWGLREQKEKQLFAKDVQTTEWKKVAPHHPFYLFVPQSAKLLAEYEHTWKLTEAVPVNVLGFQTHRDHFTIDFEEARLRNRIANLRHTAKSDDDLRAAYGLIDTKSWGLSEARKQLRNNENWEQFFIRCLYRTFDWRFCYFSNVTIDRPRRELLDHVTGKDNLCLGVGRQGIAVNDPQWSLVATSREPIDANIFRRGGINVFPLYLYPDPEKPIRQIERWPAGKDGRVPNLNAEFVADLEKRLKLQFVPDGAGDLKKTFGPEDIFHYIYAVFHSPTYRERYAEFLKIDFPRVPLTSDKEIFKSLAEKGKELVALHLLESPTLDKLFTRFDIEGSNIVERVDYTEPGREKDGKDIPGRVYINKKQYFEGVDLDVWNFHIGGYQVCQKWLKDRKGRKLSYDDVIHYQKIAAALKETIRLMEEIDNTIPSWPMK